MSRTTRTIVALALAGLAISGYLTYVHYADIKPFCTAISNCERVQSSPYSKLGGIPVALLGVLGYLAILGSALVRRHEAAMAGAFFAYGGLAFSGYLTWVELARIEAICQWCVASALLMVALGALATVRALREA